MTPRLSKSEALGRILREANEEFIDDEEIIHLILDKKISQHTLQTHEEGLTFGDKMADIMAHYAGSWKFIGGFAAFLIVWITINTVICLHAFDPYPFILLNLLLSCTAAIQAPLIMMSQNRQEQKDRIRAENDYKVGLKTELIIQDMHRKLETLIQNQKNIWDHILKLLSDPEDKKINQ